MILIGLGSNVSGPWGPPRRTVAMALRRLDKPPLALVAASTVVMSQPLGNADQPVYANAVARVRTALAPRDLLACLRHIERRAGRVRRQRWGPRTLDLDLLDYNGLTFGGRAADTTDSGLVLPHPEIAAREFVLAPIAQIAPRWRHPLTGRTAAAMLADLRKRGSAGGQIVGGRA